MSCFSARLLHVGRALAQELRSLAPWGALPLLKDVVRGLLNLNIQNLGVCKGCALDNHQRLFFQVVSTSLLI